MSTTPNSSSEPATVPREDAVAETTHTAAREKRQENLVSTWVNMMDKLLDTLHDSYSDDPSSESYDAEAGPLIATQRSQFKTFVLPSEEFQEKSIRAWHDAMLPFYDLCRERQGDAILKARCWILERIKFEHVWKDPLLDDESRGILWEYVNDLNSYANMYCTMSPDLLEKVGSIASRCEAAGHTGDLKKMSMKDVIDMSTETWKSMGSEDIREFTSNLPQLFSAVGGAKGMQSMLEQVGGGELTAVLQSALSFSQSAEGGAPPTDAPLNIGEMLASLTQAMGGAMGGPAPSGGVEEAKGADE